MTTDVVQENEPHLVLACPDDSTTESCDENKEQQQKGSTILAGAATTTCDNLSSGQVIMNGCNGTESASCGHVKKCVDFGCIKKALKTNGLENKTCQECSKSSSTTAATSCTSDPLWMCLKCGIQLCHNSVDGAFHSLQHYQKPRSDPHPLFVNTATFSVWCFMCDRPVDSSMRKKLIECIDYLKKDAKKVTINLKQQQHEHQLTTALVDTQAAKASVAAKKKEDMANVSQASPEIPTTLALSPIQGVICTDVRVLTAKPALEDLPRVRGLSNLGNTCFFNAVLQCLAQTPYLTAVLKESATEREFIQLPGGTMKDEKMELEMPPISGLLSSWQSLTAELAGTIDELQSGSGSVHNPRKLLNELTNKWPQFGDGDQHDSHELLRHLLESVRNEDLRRYQLLILRALNYNKAMALENADFKKKVKFYGQQASDRILRPEQVFRGFLVSTLTCQECKHTSSRHENFLDISLPVSAEKPQPPVRRKGSPEPLDPFADMIALPMKSTVVEPPPPSKHQLKKERMNIKKQKRKQRHQERNGSVPPAEKTECLSAGGDVDDLMDQAIASNGTGVMAGDIQEQKAVAEKVTKTGNDEDGDDVDDDDNEGDDGSSNESKSDADVEDNCNEDDSTSDLTQRLNGASLYDDDEKVEKTDDTPENPNKDKEGGSFSATNSEVAVGISGTGATNIVQQLEGAGGGATAADAGANPKRQRTVSHSDWSTTIAPRYLCEDGECSVQSCLNNFTAAELMTGNNKVGCDACTERINGANGKTINTNATKQFLISSPPAVLILHLKRFQVGPRCMFRKIKRHVTFPFLLDIAPFCGTKVKHLPNVDRGQKQLLYSLYGIVEHSGNMHGGHYVAYVKVRPQMNENDARWRFIPQGSKAELDQIDEQRQRIEEALTRARTKSTEMDSDDSTSTQSSVEDKDEEELLGAVGGGTTGMENVVQPPPGKWYYVSDSRVSQVNEDAVLKAQAYLLFYERIY